MALNPPLLAGGVPLGIVGEVFCLEREGMSLDVKSGSVKLSGNGRLYLTTMRMSFVFEGGALSVSAVDLPIQGISGENFVQP